MAGMLFEKWQGQPNNQPKFMASAARIIMIWCFWIISKRTITNSYAFTYIAICIWIIGSIFLRTFVENPIDR